jgi:zinc transport system substrate-binding protein
MTVMNAVRRPLRAARARFRTARSRRTRGGIRAVSATTALGLGAAGVLGTLGLTGCGMSHGDRKDGKVSVIASFYPMQFLAQRIGGDHVDVQSLTKPGTEPHDLELSPQQTGQLSDADLVVYLKGLQPAVDEAVAQSDARHVADASTYTSQEKHGDDVHGEKGHAHGARSGTSGADPHIWLDPVRYAQVAKGVGAQLAKADPKHKDTYRKRTRALVDRLGALDKDFRKGLKKREGDTFVTTHSAFGYLAERYGLHEEGVAGVDPEAEPSGARMRQLHTATRKNKVDTVFFEENASDRTARSLASDLHLKTDVLSPLESVQHPGKEDYFSVMRQNLAALRGALHAR